MTRGTFANVRIKNLMVPGAEGGVTDFRRAASDGAGEDDPHLRRRDGLSGRTARRWS